MTCFCFGALLLSCGDEEAEVVVNTENLMGEWELISMETEMANSTNAAGVTIDVDMNVNTTTTDYSINFDETAWSTSGSYSYEYDLVIDSNTQSDELTINDISGSGSYELEGGEIVVNGSFFEFNFQGYDMSSLTAGEQVARITINGDGNLVISQDETTEQNQGGAEITATIKATSIWRRN